jgi:hypothetical protein
MTPIGAKSRCGSNGIFTPSAGFTASPAEVPNVIV